MVKHYEIDSWRLVLQNVVRTSGWVSYSQEEKSCITVHQLTEYRNATVFEKTSIKWSMRKQICICVLQMLQLYLLWGFFFDRDYNSFCRVLQVFGANILCSLFSMRGKSVFIMFYRGYNSVLRDDRRNLQSDRLRHRLLW